MKVHLLYFASLREGLGIDRESVELPAEVQTAAGLRAWLQRRDHRFEALLAESRAVRVSIDQVMATPATPLRDGAEVAFFPPVTGG